MAITNNLIGARLGGYKVQALIGSGGMGSVYRAYDRSLNRDVAIKVVSSGTMLPDALARFRREAKLAAALSHPNIVQVYKFDEDDGVLFMVQELLPGPSLAERLRRGGRRPSTANVRRIVEQLAAALDYAHAQGVIHRDVKPDNAIFNAAGQIVLTDFGLAREDDLRASTTGPGMVMGTPAYVAPEQAVGGRGVTKACDIYALGVLSFELLTGKLPFEADSPMGVILKHLYDPPPKPRSLRGDLPAAVDGVILRALHKEPAKRYPSAGAFAAALSAALPAEKSPKNGVVARTSATPTTTKTAARKATVAQAKLSSEPAKSAPRRNTTSGSAARTTAKPTPAPAPPPAAPPKRNLRMRMRVGLITACVVGGLILSGQGIDIAQLTRGWSIVQEMMGL